MRFVTTRSAGRTPAALVALLLAALGVSLLPGRSASGSPAQAIEEARRELAAAEAEARAVREAAQEMARQAEEESRRRREELRDETRALEDARRRALDSLREIRADLDDVLADTAEERTVVREPEREQDSSLVDALAFKRRS